MARTARAKVTGTDKVLKLLESMKPKLVEEVRQEMDRQADTVKTAIQSTTAFRDQTGALRAGIVKQDTSKEGLVEFKISAGSQQFYARFIEFGHKLLKGKRATTRADRKSNKGQKFIRNIPAKPFMKPAIDENRRKILAAVRKRIRNFIKGLEK